MLTADRRRRLLCVVPVIAILVLTTQTVAASSGWARLSPTTVSERQFGGVAYDVATKQLVLFGGDNSVGVLNDTWTFDEATSRWSLLQTPSSPPARTSGALAYYPDTSAVILFGGDTHTAPNGILGDTWSFDGTTWTQLHPTHQPAARYGASIAYDAANHELVLFGGVSDAGGFLNDTWTFDGTDWTAHNTVTAPTMRYGSALGFDSMGGDVILFGGLGYNLAGVIGYQADTWAWHDHQWTQLTLTSSPSGRWAASMAPAPGGGLALFGGYSDTGTPVGSHGSNRETWLWRNGAWTQTSATGPGPRYAAAMTFNSTSQRDVLVEGCCSAVGDFWTDTWMFDGTAWSEHERADAPTVRLATSMTTDTDRGQIVLFGGSGSGFLDDTWLERNGVWTLVPRGSISPAGRFGAGMAYDTAHRATVMYGGQSGPMSGCSLTPDQLNLNHFCDDTWTFDGTAWTRQAAPNPPPFRTLPAMGNSAASGQTVMFGGMSNQADLGDTWTWDGTTWTQQSPSTSPAARSAAAMGYDPLTQQLVLFGGEGSDANGPHLFNDTWLWTGSTWRQLQPPNAPPPRRAMSLTFDPTLGGLVLFGGQGAGPGTFGDYSDCWLWNGVTWTQVEQPPSPPARYFGPVAFDPALQADIVFAGGGDDGYLDDTWALSATPPATVPEAPWMPLLVLGSAAGSAAAIRRRQGTSKLEPAGNGPRQELAGGSRAAG